MAFFLRGVCVCVCVSEGSGGSGDGSGDATGNGDSGTGSGNKKFESNLEKILADEKAKKAEQEKDIEILSSTPIEEITLESTPVDGGAETSEGTSGTGEGEAVPSQAWEEYFINKDYYKKFLEAELQSNLLNKKLLVEVYSDRMLAFIPDNDD